MKLLQDKKVFLTGGSSGIGYAIAKAFIENGAHLVFVGTNEERGNAACEELQKIASNEQKIVFMQMNVASKSEVEEKIKSLLSQWQVFDVIVNCAGITKDKLLLSMNEEDWDDVIDTNLKSVYNVVHALLRPLLKQKKGRIINISSVIGLTGNPGQVNYSSSKFGMIGFTKSLAKEIATRGITVNAIAPGFIQTKMTDALTQAQQEEILRGVPMKRFGLPHEVANVALFLASELSGYVTGEVITVDGGMLA